MAILYQPDLEHDIATRLPYLLAVDAAHLLMLSGCRLIPAATGRGLLAANRRLTSNLPDLQRRLQALPRHRGLYLAYEQLLAESAGVELLGANHLGRSRNDLNATILRLELRDAVLQVLAAQLAVVRDMAAIARLHLATPLCGFTHGQPSQPSTVGHYFAGAAFELIESAATQIDVYDQINRSPMGACAGAGTTAEIDAARVASYLGFREVVPNALAAVAGRGFVTAMAAQLAIAGILLTRVATDLQLWCSYPYDFFRLPDSLVSTSSIMPQKRNAFVFEAVRGRAAAAIGALNNVLVGQKNVPFANSIEGGTAASGHAIEQSRRTIEAMRLLALLVTSLEPQSNRGASMIEDQFTWVAGATEMIAGRHDLPYRQVHEIFGRILRELNIDTAEQLIAAVAVELGRAGVRLDENAHIELRSLAGVGAIANMRYGGGPAPDAVMAQLDILDAHIAEIDKARHERTEAVAKADARRTQAIDDYVAL